MTNRSFIEELGRRNVFRVAVAYLASAWLLIQVADTVLPRFGFTDTAVTNIIVVLGIGFVPAMILAWVFQWTPEGIRREIEASAQPARSTGKAFDRTIVAMLALAVGYFAIDKFVFDPTRDAENIQTAREEGRADAFVESYGDKSIVVLPFVNMSSDPEQEYFSDGISEELLNLLAQIPELRVISRSTAFTYKGKEIVAPEVAKKLNVAHILEGSVRKSGNKVRITAQLIDARTDTHLWSETYDRELDDIFAIQDEISARVIADLKVEIFGSPPSSQEIEPQAYEQYLRAREILHGLKEEQYDEAELQLYQVLQAEPDYLPALWELARLHERRRFSAVAARDEVQVDVHRSRIMTLVGRMVDIAPDSSQANLWLAYIAWQWNGALQEAATHFERALIAQSGNYDATFQVSRFLADLGRFEEAVVLGKYVVDRDPACSLCVSEVVRVSRKTGRQREAAEQIEALQDWRSPNRVTYWHLGVAWLVAGEPDKALAHFDKTGNPPGENLGRLLALHDIGRTAEFEREFAQFRAAQAANPEGIARVYAWTGNADEAFRWLQRMVDEQGAESVARVKTELYEKLATDTRWSAFLEKYGQADEAPLDVIFNPVFPEEVRRELENRAVRPTAAEIET